MVYRGPIFIIFFGFLANLSYAAADKDLALLKSERIAMRRPVALPPPPLEKREGLTSDELKYLRPLLDDLNLKKSDVAAREFWMAPIIKALAGLTRGPKQGHADEDDEWISRFSDQNPFDELDSNDGMERPAQPVVFLSQTGFQRLKDAEEMTASSGREILGQVPVADFCETRPGRDIPINFSTHFSPWEFGATLASSNRLDATLMDLVLHPDAFDLDDYDGIADAEERDNFDNDEREDRSAWALLINRFESRISKGQLSLTDFAAKVRNDATLSQDLRRLVLAAAVTSVDFRKVCKNRGGVWTEMVWDPNDSLDFFACRNTSGELFGPKFTVEDGDLDEGDITFSIQAGPVLFSAVYAADANSLRVATFVSGNSIGAEFLIGNEGNIRASRSVSEEDGPWVFFDKKNLVEFAQRLTTDKHHKNISFYADGKVRAFSHLDASGNVDFMASYYSSGQPRFYMPWRNGKPDGSVSWWHPSGQLAGELTFVSGKRFGPGRLLYQNGIEGFRAEYSENEPHGRMLWRDPAGHLLFSLGYVGGKAHGLMEIRLGGRSIVEARFEGGVVEGVITLRNNRGIGVAEIPYSGGLLNGEALFRDAGGALRAKSKWLDGQVDGTTEAYYSSGNLASRCRFSKGKLIEWFSQRPDGVSRYRGTVKTPGEGSAEIDYFGGSKSAVIRCKTMEWQVEQCSALGKAGISAPGVKDLMSHVVDAGELQFKPERCGGVVRTMDVTGLVDHSIGNVHVSYRVKELCRGEDLATRMQCDLQFTGKNWAVKSCEISDEEL